MRSPEKYGRFYWCVKTDLSENGEIYVHADEVNVNATGDIAFTSTIKEGEFSRNADPSGRPVSVPTYRKQQNLVIAQGHWTAYYAASVMDGSPIAVDHWEGEVME